jgi:hypothetical protein
MVPRPSHTRHVLCWAGHLQYFCFCVLFETRPHDLLQQTLNWDYRVAFQCRLKFNLKCKLWHWLRKSFLILISEVVSSFVLHLLMTTSSFHSVIISKYTLFTFECWCILVFHINPACTRFLILLVYLWVHVLVFCWGSLLCTKRTIGLGSAFLLMLSLVLASWWFISSKWTLVTVSKMSWEMLL